MRTLNTNPTNPMMNVQLNIKTTYIKSRKEYKHELFHLYRDDIAHFDEDGNFLMATKNWEVGTKPYLVAYTYSENADQLLVNLNEAYMGHPIDSAMDLDTDFLPY